MTTSERVLGVVGLVMYLAAGFLYLGAGLLVPEPWYVFMWALWIAGWVVTIRVFRTRRSWTAVVAVGAVALWYLVVGLGGLLLGWTA